MKVVGVNSSLNVRCSSSSWRPMGIPLASWGRKQEMFSFFPLCLLSLFSLLSLQSPWSLFREDNRSFGCCVSNQEAPALQLYVSPPLPERSCWATFGLATALSAIAFSTAVISLALSPHLWSNPYTSGCTNQWMSQVYWYMLCRGTFFLFMDVWLVVNE